MKTPRELLLERHQKAAPGLDAIRQSVVASIGKPVADSAARKVPRNLAALFLTFWCEAILPARRIWVGLAAAWLLILVANHELASGIPRRTASPSPLSAGFIMTVREREQVMSGFTQRAEPELAEPPKRPSPLPRSQAPKAFYSV